MDSTINNRRLTTHCIEWERTVGISLYTHFILYLNSRTLKLVEFNLSYVECHISSLRLQNTVVVTTSDGREIKLINLLSSLHRDINRDVLCIATPTILGCELNTRCILISSHVKTYQIVTLCQLILTTREDKELVPSAIWLIVQSTVLDRRLAAHCIMWEWTIRRILIALRVDQLLDLCIRIDVELLIFEQFLQPLQGLLSMPCQCMTINRHTIGLSIINKCLNILEVQITILIHTRSHFHCISCCQLHEVGISQTCCKTVGIIVICLQGHSQLEIGRSLRVRKCFKRIVIIQVLIVLQILSLILKDVDHVCVGT